MVRAGPMLRGEESDRNKRDPEGDERALFRRLRLVPFLGLPGAVGIAQPLSRFPRYQSY